MSHDENSSRKNMVGILVALFIALFASLLLFFFSPWEGFGPESGQEGDGAAIVSQGDDQTPAIAPPADLTGMPVIEMELESGTVVIQMRPDLAPNHVAQIVELTNEGFYDGIVFHRVIEGFMAQTGDPTGTGMGGSELPDISAEFTDTTFVRGTVGMARSASPDSANSQFFIVYDNSPFLDGKYTVVGEVISGMDYVDDLKKGSQTDNGQVENPDAIISMRVVSAE